MPPRSPSRNIDVCVLCGDNGAEDCNHSGKHTAGAKWRSERHDAEFELVDIAEYDLPLLNEPVPPSMGQYTHPHTKVWAAKIASFDAYVFVTPEYNHSTSAALKDAIDYLYKEWNNKAAGFVSYGSAMETRAVEHLRLTMAELQIADVRAQGRRRRRLGSRYCEAAHRCGVRGCRHQGLQPPPAG